jgi:hypothetical protein
MNVLVMIHKEMKCSVATHEVIVVLDALLANRIIPATCEEQQSISPVLLAKHMRP